MQTLDVRQLQGFLAEHPQTLLLDVREPWEVQLARLELPGARSLHLPMMQVPMRLSEIDASQPVVCICHHGGRSGQVAMFLSRQGYENAYNLTGGINAWSILVDPAVPRY